MKAKKYGVRGCHDLRNYILDTNNILSGGDFDFIYFYNDHKWTYRRIENSKRQTLPIEEYLKLIEPETMEEVDFRCGKASAEFDKKGTETLIKRIEKRGYTVTKNNSKEIKKTMESKQNEITIVKTWETIYFKSKNATVELTLNHEEKTFDLQTAREEMVSFKSDTIDVARERLKCIESALDYAEKHLNK